MGEPTLGEAFQSLPFPVIRVSRDGAIVEADQAFLELLNFPAKDLIGRPLADFGADAPGGGESKTQNPESQISLARLHEQTIQTGPVKGCECTLRDRSGKVIPVSVSTRPRTNAQGRTVGYLAAFAELNGRRQAAGSAQQIEADPRASEERFRQLAENAREWIWEVDRQGVYTWSSPVIEQIMGYLPEELVGKKRFYDLYLFSESKTLKDAVLKAFAERRPLRDFLTANVHKDGHTVWLSTSGVPITGESGTLIGYRGATLDYTERYRAERQRSHVNTVLRAIRNANQLALRGENLARLLKQVCAMLIETGGYASAWAVTFEPFVPGDMARTRVHLRNLPPAPRACSRPRMPVWARSSWRSSKTSGTDSSPSASGAC